MTAPGEKNGPLTAADLQAIWEGAADRGYTEPLIQAGEGEGFEVWTQMFAQFARASEAIDVSTQALFILPGSGQSNPPAQRAGFAVVELTVSRGNTLAGFALTLAAGQVLVGEEALDWGVRPGDVGVPVLTGREYALLSPLVFAPGDLGPHTVFAQATKPGYGYNNPQPGSINAIDQPGVGYANVEASVFVATAPGVAVRATLVAANEPDMFLPSQLGQYVELTAGSNAGAVGRVAGFVAPVPSAAQGSGVLLAWEQAVSVTGVTGAFLPGEPVTFSGGATANLLGVDGAALVYELVSGAANPAIAETVAGVNSGAAATVSNVLQGQRYVPETDTASWRVLDWVVDLQVLVTNAEQPAGGTSAMLDELGSERSIPGGTNEPADTYRKRVAQVADTVSPNAIRRATAKALGAIPWCFREVGDPQYLPGLFFDKPPQGSPHEPLCFYDTNCLLMTFSGSNTLQAGEPLTWLDSFGQIVGYGYYAGQLPSSGPIAFALKGSRPPNRLTFAAGDTVVGSLSGSVEALATVTDPACRVGMREKVWLDYLRMRAYFQIAVPDLDLGEFGFFYDVYVTVPSLHLLHIGGFYDEKVTGRNGYDGYAWGAAQQWRVLWQDVERVRAGGTTWDLIEDGGPCP